MVHFTSALRHNPQMNFKKEVLHCCKKVYSETARLFLPQATIATGLSQWSENSLGKQEALILLLAVTFPLLAAHVHNYFKNNTTCIKLSLQDDL